MLDFIKLFHHLPNVFNDTLGYLLYFKPSCFKITNKKEQSQMSVSSNRHCAVPTWLPRLWGRGSSGAVSPRGACYTWRGACYLLWIINGAISREPCVGYWGRPKRMRGSRGGVVCVQNKAFGFCVPHKPTLNTTQCSLKERDERNGVAQVWRERQRADEPQGGLCYLVLGPACREHCG